MTPRKPAEEATQRAPQKATKSSATARPATQPAGATKSFGEHTPAFMLRPVNVA
jgi:hypothetical protein